MNVRSNFAILDCPTIVASTTRVALSAFLVVRDLLHHLHHRHLADLLTDGGIWSACWRRESLACSRRVNAMTLPRRSSGVVHPSQLRDGHHIALLPMV